MGEQGGESPRWAWAATASALLPTIRLDSLARQLRAARGDALSADGWLRPLRAPSLREQCLTALPASQQSLRVRHPTARSGHPCLLNFIHNLSATLKVHSDGAYI